MFYLSNNGVSSIASDTVVTVFLALLTVATVVAAVVFLCRFAADKSRVDRGRLAVFVVIACGFVLRLVFAMCVRGFREDYKIFTDMFDHLDSDGLNGYYNGDTTKVLYPVVYFVYLVFGGLSNVTGLSGFELGTQFMVKLPLIIADLAAALAVYRIADKYFGQKIGITLCAFVCACPAFFIASSLWSSPIAFVVAFACWACYFLARKNYAATVVFATLAAFSGKEGLFLFPTVAVFGIYHIVRCAINIRRDAPEGRAALASEYNAVYTVPAAFLLSVVGAYLLGLFMIASYSYDPFKYIYEFLLRPLGDWQWFTYNGLSIYAVFGQNGQEPAARFPSAVFVTIFAVIIFAVVCVVYFTKRNRATLVMLAAYSFLTFSLYLPGSTAVTVQPVLPLLLAAYALVRDKRLLYIFAVTATAYTVNASVVLANAGYINNLADHIFTGADYSGTTLLSGGIGAVTIACSAVTALAHLYFTLLTVSVGMTGQKKLLRPAVGVGASIKELFARVKAE